MQSDEGKPLRIERVAKEVFEKKHLGHHAPVIITDALSDWKALAVWSPEYLASVLKTKRVQVAVSQEDRFKFRPRPGAVEETIEFQLETMEFSSLVERIGRAGRERLYVTQKSIPDEFPELLPDIKTPRWIKYDKPIINLWFGGANNVTTLHYDLTNNYYAQIYGRKRFTIFDPMQTELLYPYPVNTSVGHISDVDVEQPDLVKHPRFRRARPFEFIIETGELLYLPAYWWHHVRSLSAAISVNFWSPSEFEQRLWPNALRQLTLFYEADRLMGIKADLVAQGMNFISVAGLLQRMKRKWAAVLLAGAALEEFVRELARRHAIPHMSGKEFRPLTAISADLHAAHVFSPEQTRQVAVWGGMIIKALAGDDEQFTDAEVASLVSQIRSFASAASPLFPKGL
jgi:ribosomal protein L16 Arg81 hydroxylase